MYSNEMFTQMREFLLNLVFPERKQEKVVHTLTDTEIFALPKARENNNSRIPDLVSLFSYKDARVQALIWELKYHRNSRALQIVGQLLAEAVMEELSEKALFENMSSILLVPIPVTPKRLRERKFSQTDLICREMLKHLPAEIVYEPDALKKIRETEKQSWSKGRAERLKNLRGALQADEKVVSGKTIIIIDDVTTTGATLSEATRALTSAHAKRIFSFTLAH